MKETVHHPERGQETANTDGNESITAREQPTKQNMASENSASDERRNAEWDLQEKQADTDLQD
jgi:hypothetical protein